MEVHSLWLGLDVGSTTVKAVVVDPLSKGVLFSAYERHGAQQVEVAGELLARIRAEFPGKLFRAAVCGSGGKGLAEATGAWFIQEVVANSVAVREGFGHGRTAIELGGQDAKIIFFHYDTDTGLLVASDMRMNGSCAGGTGAFIDEVASILNIPVEEFDAFAARGTHVYDISGRCGVFAKTDIQPLLNQGVAKEDIALSTFHAIAKQSIGGLAQGLEIKAPVIFVGGPLTFNRTLVRVFAERLGLGEGDVIIPPDPQTMVAWGTALAIPAMERGGERPFDLDGVGAALARYQAAQREGKGRQAEVFFASDAERAAFAERHRPWVERAPVPPAGTEVDVWIGIDGGSTTSKCVALDSFNRVLGSWYSHNRGKPLEVMRDLLLEMEGWFTERGLRPRVRGMGTTGYAELLFAKAFGADHHMVETVSHTHAARHYVPQASFVLDIGGQDMKAIVIQNDIVTGIVLNEACSAGCGSFLENFAGNLKIPVGQIADRAFASSKPSILGSRCTVFMNSSIITEQKNGKGPDDIMAGLCRSIVENVFTKVMRVSNFDSLGPTMVVQGGTFKNDAVLRAMEQYTGRQVIRAPYPGEMGAIGIALLTREYMEGRGGAGVAGRKAATPAHSSARTHGAAPRNAVHGVTTGARGQSVGAPGIPGHTGNPATNDNPVAGSAAAPAGQGLPGAVAHLLDTGRQGLAEAAHRLATLVQGPGGQDPAVHGHGSGAGRPVPGSGVAGEGSAAGGQPLPPLTIPEPEPTPSAFIGFEALRAFTFTQESGLVCKLCTNNCARTVIRFSDGGAYVTGNRCERGEVVDAPSPRTQVSDGNDPGAAGSAVDAAAGSSATRAAARDNTAHGPGTADAALAAAGAAQNAVPVPGAAPNHPATSAPATSVAAPVRAPRPVATPDLMAERNRLLFADYPSTLVSPAKDMCIGIPRVLEFWNSLPFWRTFWQALGFRVEVSSPSSQKLFQDGLQNVPSDTVCFPAKVVHGHVRNLVDKKVDRIFMPMQNRLPPENKATTGTHVCAVVKGYPLVIQNSDDPGRRAGIPLDHPMFHWFTIADRDRQLSEWCAQTFNLPQGVVQLAIDQAATAQASFQARLLERGATVLEAAGQAHAADPSDFAVVLAGRPYHGDMLINHELSGFFRQRGISVLTVDSLPGLNEVDLSATRAEITNPFHARMYAAAMLVARDPRLELVQIVSFGCGHDAIISDEITRLMGDISGKTPLVLKLDESDVKGPLNIRVRSFIETVKARRAKTPYVVRDLPDPFAVKFTKVEKKVRTILVPNVTPAWTKMISAAIRSEGYKVEPMPMADHEAILLGKQYVHNDMCYPAQVNVGEMLGALRSGRFDPDTVACGLAKSQCDCRLAHYAALARKALDEAGYPQVPIITTDKDTKGMHPGFSLGLKFQILAVWGLNIVDVLEHLARRLRPYELVKGSVDDVFEESVVRISQALSGSVRKAKKEYAAALERFAAIPADFSRRKPRVFIIGEFLLNFHSSSNMKIETYLEDHDMEAVLPATFTPIHRDYLKLDSEIRQFFVKFPLMEVVANDITLGLIDHIQSTVWRMARARVPFFEPPIHIRDLAATAQDILHHSFTPGEGWLIPAEILHHASHGINSFIILQPFGCMPNHVVGRGLTKTLKERYPRIQILPLDFDPDTSFANIENRLQMLIINARELEDSAGGRQAARGAGPR